MPSEPDPVFSNPRLAELYDLFDGQRDDLDLYEDIAEELGATRVLDVGCGTGALAVRLSPLVTFDTTFVFPDERVVSTSVLRFRTMDDITADLDRAGFVVRSVRDAPDRPGREWVFVAERAGTA